MRWVWLSCDSHEIILTEVSWTEPSQSSKTVGNIDLPVVSQDHIEDVILGA